MDKLPQGEPSPEQLMNLLESLQRQGMSLDEISPDLGELMRNVKKEKGQPTEDIPTEEIEPEPGFVIKTQDTATHKKVFINVCGSDKVPAPGNWSNGQVPEEVQKALENRDGSSDAESLRFPLSAGQLKTDTDKRGDSCMTVDCILNSDVLKQAAVFRPLKAFLIELAIGWVGHKSKMTLDEKFKLPKMRYKGDVVEKQNIRMERKPLVCEVRDVPDEPSFPLMTKKPKQHQQKQDQPAEAVSSPAPSSCAVTAAAGPHSKPSAGVPPSSASSSVPVQTVGKPALKHSIEFMSRPVDEVLVTVQGSPQQSSSAGPSGQQSQASTSNVPWVEVAGRSVFVSVPGYQELHVQLPFAVQPPTCSETPGRDSAGCSAEYDAQRGQLKLRLKYMPLRDYMQQMRQEKPLPFGQLGLGTAGLLELE